MRILLTGAVSTVLALSVVGPVSAQDSLVQLDNADSLPLVDYNRVEEPITEPETLEETPASDPTENGREPEKSKPKKDKPQVETKQLNYRISPGAEGKYGVGQLVTISFSRDVGRRKAVEDAITVTSNKKMARGAWGWIDRRTAIYRPKRFWPGNARIQFDVQLRDALLAVDDGVHYRPKSNRTYVLRTSRKFVMKIKDSTHRLHAIRDGKRLRSFPVSLGKTEGGYQTRSGIKILTSEKYVRLRMIGTDRLSGEDWDVISPYSIRLTPTGEFIHGAPWAYSRIGLRNGSHGCTNMRVEDAKWLFNRVMRGDPTVTTGTGRKMEVTNGTPGSYWNYSWNDWLKKSTTKGLSKGDGTSNKETKKDDDASSKETKNK